MVKEAGGLDRAGAARRHASGLMGDAEGRTMATHTWSYPEALRAIWARSAYDHGYVSNPFADATSGRLGLRRTAALLDRLGNPQERYGIVHVAGSKGKGS